MNKKEIVQLKDFKKKIYPDLKETYPDLLFICCLKKDMNKDKEAQIREIIKGGKNWKKKLK